MQRSRDAGDAHSSQNASLAALEAWARTIERRRGDLDISDETQSGFIELGFEFHNGTERRVVMVQGHEWAVWRLRSNLEGLDTDNGSGQSNPPEESWKLR